MGNHEPAREEVTCRESFAERSGRVLLPQDGEGGMAATFLLSVLEPHASFIATGRKRWEFRENPDFGRIQGQELRHGDRLFIVAMGASPAIPCVCRVGRILRGQAVREYFGDPLAERWREAGFDDGGPAFLKRFSREILDVYATAVELAATPLAEPVAVERILHRHTGKPWSGKGFTPLAMLHRYSLDGMDLETALAGIIPRGV